MKRLVAAASIPLILAVAGWWAFTHVVEPPAPGPANTLTQTEKFDPRVAERRIPPPGSLEYKSVQYGFSLLYPQGLIVTETPGAQSTMTLTIQSSTEARGFQVFILPYLDEQVSQARFAQDIPSGVRTNPADTTVDGATAASFYSTDARLGDTYEVWVLHGGYLYEITTLKPLDSWLNGILTTWKFL